jgi:SAM-dependent methyltransferase
MKILNLGCGSKTSPDPSVVNIDFSIMSRIRSSLVLKFFAPILLNAERLQRFNALPDNLVAHNLSKGIPSTDSSVDVVYHSHMLEHLERDVAGLFMREVLRVLKPGGVLRVVVPDFERCCREYLDHVLACEGGDEGVIQQHDVFVETVLLQSVRREAFGTSQQKPLRRFIENFFLGDARQRGETHQWMYDRYNLSCLLTNTGFSQTFIQSYNKSNIPRWDEIGLDRDSKGYEYKPGSLYMEAVK